MRSHRIPKAADVLADRLRTYILSANLPPDSPLFSEAELVRQSGFSRATVREALRLLESERIVIIKRGPGGGIAVGRPDEGQISHSLALLLRIAGTKAHDLVAFRKVLEPEAAALAARNATKEEREAILDNARHGGSVSELVDFHDLVAEGTGNEFFRVTQKSLHYVVLANSSSHLVPQEDEAHARRSHRKIAEAIDKGDGELAAVEMLKHLRLFERLMSELGMLDDPIVPEPPTRATLDIALSGVIDTASTNA